MDETKNDFESGRICTICGAKALGYNFGVISCESCKAFFRRNAFKDEGVQCPFANCCTINEKSRRFCQACRLAKCYKAGMKRDWSSQGKVKKEDDPEEETSVLKKRVREWRPSIPPPTDPITRPCTASISSSTPSMQSIFPASPSVAIPITAMSDQVTIPKDVFMQLIHHAQCKSKMECSCKCSCGFYPPETRLMAKTTKSINGIPPQPPPSIIPLLTGPLSVPGLEAFSPLMNSSLDLFPSSSGLWTPPNLWSESLSHLATPPSNHGMSSAAASCYAPSPLVANPSSVQSIPPGDFVPTTPQDKSPLAVENADEFSKNFAAIGRNPAVYEKLTLAHRSLLIELLRANEGLRMPLADLKKEVYTLLDAAKCAEIAIRRMIMMAKNLKTFTDLPNLDQMTLIKGGAVEMMILRGAMIYDPHNRMWKYDLTQGASEDGQMPAQMEMSLDILKGSGSQHFLAHHKFLASFDDRIRTNEVLMMVINAIILFTPDRIGLKKAEEVRAANEKYYDLILRILECEFSSITSREMLIRIDTVIKQLKSLNSSMMEVVYGIDSSQLDPLIVEVFDLKTKNSP